MMLTSYLKLMAERHREGTGAKFLDLHTVRFVRSFPYIDNGKLTFRLTAISTAVLACAPGRVTPVRLH